MAQSEVEDLRTREADMVQPPRPSSEKLWCKSQSLEARKPGALLSRGRKKKRFQLQERKAIYLSLPFIRSKPPANWMSLTHTEDRSCPLSPPTHINSPLKYFDTIQRTLPSWHPKLTITPGNFFLLANSQAPLKIDSIGSKPGIEPRNVFSKDLQGIPIHLRKNHKVEMNQ